MLDVGRFAAAGAAVQLSGCTLHQKRVVSKLTTVRRGRVSEQAQLQRQLCCISADLHASASRLGGVAIDPEQAPALRQALRAAAALLAAVCLHLGGPNAASALSLASVSEDSLLGLVRAMETRIDGAVSAAREALPAFGGASAAEQQAERQAGRALIDEVYEVVDQNFTDARDAGFDPGRWRRARDAAAARPLRDRAAAYSAVRGMLAELRDPYSRFITPDEFLGMLKYDVSGVGLNLGTLEELRAKTGLGPPTENSNGGGGGGVWVVGLIRGSAADRAGLRQGDELLQADDAALGGRSPFEVASLLQGGAEATPARADQSGAEEPAPVRLSVRHLDGSTESVSLLRAAPPLTQSPVTARLQRGDRGGGAMGYVRLRSFDARAQRDVTAAVRRLLDGGASRLTLDLRGNRGGLVNEGIEVARLFLDDGAVVVRTEGKARSPVPITAAGPPLASAPLAVLVDGHTASASEIVAGALKDNCRAVLVGARTYGKGLIQSVYELGDGSGLVLTVGKYLTPAGTDIDREGIAPDFGAIPTAVAADEAVAACKVRSGRT